MPLVSIIVPVYNTGAYLQECLDHLVGQTLEDIEIIVINDGSTDESEKIKMCIRDSVRHDRSTKNRGY